jgi:Restriction Endonuclease associating with ARP
VALKLIRYEPQEPSARRSSGRSGAYFVSQLRRELSARNRAFASQRELLHVESYGGVPVVVYRPHENDRRHGNFVDKSYAAILSCPAWQRRLSKTHAQARTSLPKCDRGWKELDSSNSSDALLMNIFCYPGVAGSPMVASLMGVEPGQLPEFGFKARVPLKSGRADRTEVDMRLGDLLVEAKLTEADFQTKQADVVRGYRDFRKVFQAVLLPKAGERFLSYQLIRNVLAAHANGCSFCVLLDARRPDLLEGWYEVMRAVRLSELRLRCKVLTWQELTGALPAPLREFLDLKYGVVPPGSAASPIPGCDGTL